MPMDQNRILLIDDNPADRALTIRELKIALGTVQVLEIRTAEELREALRTGSFDLAITDYELNWSNGLDVLQQVKQACPDCPVIMFTGSGNEEVAVEGLKCGLDDYVSKKPRQYASVAAAVLRTLQRQQERQALRLVEQERHRIAEALRLNEKFAELGRMAGIIAHEINNPLESVTNLLYLLRSSGRLEPDLDRFVETAEAEVARVAHIAKQTLTFYRESNRPLETSIPDLLDGLLAMYVQKINSHIQVERHYRNVPVALVYTSQIRQVFSNLIGNALEAMPHRGTLKLFVRESSLWGRPTVRGLRVTVADTGRGIAPELRQKLFQAFFTTKGDRGTGLGLWVSQGIIANHHGTIHACSSTRPGRHGTVFSVFLPFADAQSPERTEASVDFADEDESVAEANS